MFRVLYPGSCAAGKQNVLDCSKAVKCKMFFVDEFSFSTNDNASLALLSQGGNVSQHRAYICSYQGSRLGLNSSLDKIGG